MPALDIHVVATLEGSLVHGGGSDGSNVTLFRRELVAGPDGVVSVPVMSGNGWRGVLRRHGAWLLADILGVVDGGLGVDAVRIISSGGALRQETGLPPDQTRVVVDIPHLHLFGFSGLGNIHAGSLIVSKLLPVCAETAHVTGVDTPVRAAKLLGLEQFTRHDHSPVTPDAPDAAADATTSQMIYQVETLAVGTRLVGRLGLRPWATAADYGWLHATLRSWQHAGGHLGGRSATGHGRLDVGDIIDHAAADRAVSAAADTAADTLTALRWLH